MKRWMACLLFLSGCSTFSKKQCEQFDWTSEGQKMALQGRTLPEAKSYFDRECRVRHEVAPDAARLEDGYRGGLKDFCTPESIERFAANGGEYQGTCDTQNSVQLTDKYKSTRIKFLETQNRKQREQISVLRSRVSTLESENSSLRLRCP